MWEYHMKVDGFRRSEDRQWHKVRVLASIMLSPHAKKGKRIKPEDLISLSDEVKKAHMSKEAVKKDVEVKMKAYRKHKRKHG